MPHQVLQSSTHGFYIFADDADAYGEGLSGLSISVSLSKGGGAFNAVSPTVTDLGGGVYWIAPLAAHRDTLGEIAWRFTAAGAVIAPRFERVVAVNDQVAAWGANTVAPDNAGIAAAQLAAETAADLLGSMTGPDVRKLTFIAHTGEDPETGSPVLGVQIWIAGRVITTGTAGDAEIKLNPGTYNTVIITPIGFAVVADIEVVIGADDVTVPIAMVSTGSAVTPPPGACAVTVPVVDQSGLPIEGVSIAAKLTDGYAVAADSMAINAADSKTTDSDGLVTLILIREQDYNLTAVRNDCSVTIKIRTPDAEAATLGQVVIG